MKLRPDIMGTADGLSKYPYIRESRRMVASGRVIEQDIVDEYWPGPRARWFDDSIGIGFYMVDIHPCGANERGRMMMPKPFQIPLADAAAASTPVNFLPAGKNIGVTHLTNGAFRLHPIEWMVGEAAGTVASLAIAKGAVPELRAVQADLAQAGVPIVWFDDLPVDHPAFAAITIRRHPRRVSARLGSARVAGRAHHARRSGCGARCAFRREAGSRESRFAPQSIAAGWQPTTATGFIPTCRCSGPTSACPGFPQSLVPSPEPSSQ